MTTGIAGICGGRKAIVLAADKMLGFGHVQSAVGDKILRLHKNWRVLYAGNDVSLAYPLIDRAVAILGKIPNPTALEVATAMTSAWAAERDMRTEAKVLKGRPGWTLKRFFDKGKNHFLPQEVARLTDAIEAEELGLELLIAGFDDKKRPLIMSMDRHGNGIPERRAGYWAIGSGADNAMMFLSWRELKRSTPIRGALANVLEAKYYGELAPDVSEETDLLLIQPDKEEILIPDQVVEDVFFQQIAIANRPRNVRAYQLQLLNDVEVLNKAGIPYVWADQKREMIDVPYDEMKKPKPKYKWIKPHRGGGIVHGAPQTPRGTRAKRISR